MNVKALISSGIGVIVVYLSCKIWNQTKQLRNNEITIQQLEEQNRNQLLEIRNLEIKAQASDQKDQQILLQKQQLENKTQTLTNQEITIQNQKESLKKLENQIQVKNLEIQNLNKSIRNENIRVKDQINNLQVLLVEKEKNNQELFQSLSSSKIKQQKQKKNMIDRITQLLEIEIVTAIKQRIADALKDFFIHFNIEQEEVEDQ